MSSTELKVSWVLRNKHFAQFLLQSLRNSVGKRLSPALWRCRYLSALFKLLWGIFITLFFLSSHLCFTYKSWYFDFAHKQHEAFIFPAYCKPDFSPASIIRKGTAHVKPHQKVWKPIQKFGFCCKSPCFSVFVVFEPPCFSPWLMTMLGQRCCPFYQLLPHGGCSGKQEIFGCWRKEFSTASVEFLFFIYATEAQPRTEVMTSCLCSNLPSSDQCTKVWFLGRKFFKTGLSLKGWKCLCALCGQI